MNLSECPQKSNNLQLLRFVSAMLVIFSHSFSISTGDGTKEWISFLTKNQISFGGLAVSVFFCAGGYLVAKSMLRVKNGMKYFRARFIKIFPPLVAVVIATAFILGPIATDLNVGDYFKNKMTYLYLLNGGMILQHDLPGVFVDNPSVATVNGSLWTLPIEFLCYIVCYLMWRVGLLQKKSFKWSIPIVGVSTIFLYKIIQYIQIDILLSAIRPALLSYMGMMYYVYRDKVTFTIEKVIVCIIILVLSSLCGVLDIGMVLCFPYILLYICFVIPQVSERLGQVGNLSYGMYLCGFPIQQVLVKVFGGTMSPYINFILSFPIVIIFGMLIYYWIELPIIRFEKKNA